MARAGNSATGRLAKLRESEVTERQAQRDLAAKADAATAAVDHARGALVEAHATGEQAGIRRAEKAHDHARTAAETAGIKAEAADLRVRGAEDERQRFEKGSAEALIAELKPRAQAVVEQLDRSANELLEANTEWETLNQRVGQLLLMVNGASPTNDAPIQHRLAAAVREVRNVLRAGGETEPPLPHWRGAHAFRQSQQEAVAARQEKRDAAAVKGG